MITCPSEAVIAAVSAMHGRIAVLGAGGKMGFHISRMLQRSLRAIERDDRVITVSRFHSPATRDQFAQAGFEVVAADLSDPVAVSQLPDADQVIFLAGVKFGTADDPQLLHQMNVQVPRLVVQRYRDASFAALSTGCVYSFSTPESGGSVEGSPTRPPGDYARSCLGREAEFVAAAEARGTRSTLIRLNYSIDLRYGVLMDIAQTVFAGRPVSLNTGYVNIIWQGDAVSHILQSMELASAPPCVLNVTGPDVLSVREIAERFGALFGCRVTFDGVEQPTAWLSNAQKSHGYFGRPQVTTDTMIRWTAEWLLRGGTTLGKPTHFEVRDDSY